MSRPNANPLKSATVHQWTTLLDTKSHLHEIVSHGQSILSFCPSLGPPDYDFRLQIQEAVQASSDLLEDIINHPDIPPEVGDVAYFAAFLPLFVFRKARLPRILSVLKFRYFREPLGNFNAILQELRQILKSDDRPVLDSDFEDLAALDRAPCDFKLPDELTENLRRILSVALPEPVRIPQKLKDEVDKFCCLANFHAHSQSLGRLVEGFEFGWEVLEERAKVRGPEGSAGSAVAQFYKECYRQAIEDLKEVSFRLAEADADAEAEREKSGSQENPAKVQELTVRIEELTAENKNLQRALERQQEEHARLQQEIQVREEESGGKKKENAVLSQEIEAKKKENAVLSQEIEALKQENEILKRDNAGCKGASSDPENEVTRLQQENAVLSQEIEGLKQENEILKRDNAECKGALSDPEKEVTRLQQENARLETENQGLKQENEILTRDNVECKGASSNREKEIRRLQRGNALLTDQRKRHLYHDTETPKTPTKHKNPGCGHINSPVSRYPNRRRESATHLVLGFPRKILVAHQANVD
jgi:hypothetical protein